MASGTTLATFDSYAAKPPASAYPQLDLKNGHAVLDFDGAADESTDFPGVLPSIYRGGDLVVVITFAATSGATGAVAWSAAFERIQAGVTDLAADAFGSVSSAAFPAASTPGVGARATLTVPSSSLSGAVAGDPYRVRISRRATDAGDTLVGDAELLCVELLEA